jgi:hypothetical protein
MYGWVTNGDQGVFVKLDMCSAADRNLILASPGLFEACACAERVLSWYEKNGANNAELLVVRAALAKATGGEA